MVDICKQWRPWSDAAFCGVWSGSALFASYPLRVSSLQWVWSKILLFSDIQSSSGFCEVEQCFRNIAWSTTWRNEPRHMCAQQRLRSPAHLHPLSKISASRGRKENIKPWLYKIIRQIRRTTWMNVQAGLSVHAHVWMYIFSCYNLTIDHLLLPSTAG